MDSITNSSNLFIPHYELSQYEINKHGVVRAASNKKIVVCGSNGRVQLKTDGGYLHRLVHKEVQKTFYPELGNKREAMTYDETYGWQPNDNASIETKLKRLMSGEVCMSIKARKMHNNNINFSYVGFVDEDEPTCLIYNEDEDKTTLYHNTAIGENEVEYGDVLYHLRGNERTNDGKYDTSILENMIMAKYYYLKHKAEEYDLGFKRKALYDKYFSYDFEEKFDDWCDKLEAHQAEKVGKIPKGFKQVKPVNRVAKMLGQREFTDEEREKYNEEKERATKLKRMKQQQQEQDFITQQDNAIKNETAQADRIMHAIQNDKPFFKRFADVNGAPSVHDFQSCVDWCRSSSKIYRQKRDQQARQEEKKNKTKAERRAELQKELSLLND